MIRALSVSMMMLCPTFLVAQEESYPTPPEAIAADNVPQGRIDGPHEFRSAIYPGTVRKYWIYVPADYEATQPPCLMVVQDGYNKAKDWKLPTVLDTLIQQREIPVQLGVFIDPGIVPAAHEFAQPRYNRSFEYDAVGDRYARFLLEEILPEVANKYPYSSDPNDHLIAGSSSGAICAFTAAWERPDAFRRVFSTVGTYVGLRGGNEYPTLIRKTEPKPLRIFLQDGSNDLDIYAGSWWNANRTMLSALQFSGYDVRHVWGEGGHNGLHAAAILPNALRWLWRDYPQPIRNLAGKQRRTDLLIDGEDWQRVSRGHKSTDGPAVSDTGEVYFTDVSNNRIHRIDRAGHVSVFAEATNAAGGLAFGPDKKLYACQHDSRQVVRYTLDGQQEVFLSNVAGNDIVVLANGSGYVTEPSASKIWHFTANGRVSLADEGIDFPNGIAVSPDQTALTVSDTHGRFCYAFRIEADGRLSHKQEYGWLHGTDALQTEADGMAVDTAGRTYVSTALGIQVLDQPGRVHFILSSPHDSQLSNLVFGGDERDMLYATGGDSVYRRRVNATGAEPRKSPIHPPTPHL